MSQQCFLLSNSSSLYCSIQLCEGGTVTDLAKNVTIRGRKIDEIMISYIMRDTARVSLASITIFSKKKLFVGCNIFFDMFANFKFLQVLFLFLLTPEL